MNRARWSHPRQPTGRWAVRIALVAAAVALAAAAPDGASDAQGAAKGQATQRTDKKDLPLDSERTIEFATDEGSWISLDVAPDGRSIVFELLGDLYTLPIAGGEATRITSGMAFDSQPRYSPDGAKIVFLSDRGGAENVWTIGADGSGPKAITKGKLNVFRSPDWTPDGQYIVVSKSSGPPPAMPLMLYHMDGGSGVKLTGNSDEQKTLFALGPAFGKDPRYVYFTQRTASGSVYNQMEFRWQLAVHDRQTGEHFRQSDEFGSAMRPALSPDGRWLVYATRWDAQTGLRLRDLSSGDDKWMVYPVQRDDQESASTRDLMPGASFTPDSKAFVTAFDGRIWRVEVPSGTVTPIPFSAKVEQKLGPKVHFDHAIDEGPVRAQQIRYPRLSPDGRKLAFTALDRVYLMDFPGGTPKRVSAMAVGEHQPAWSPDGRHLAYITWSDTEDGGHVYRVPRDGGTPQKLSDVAAFYSDPVYAPDGERIVVVRGPREERREDFSPQGRGGQSMQLGWLPASGGAVTLISPYRGPGRPHFGPERDRIYVWEGTAEGRKGLVSFRFDGTDRRAHVKVTGYKSPNAERALPASEVVISPDGTRAIVEAERRVYLVTIPVVGGEAPTISVAEPEGAAVPVKRLSVVGGEFLAWANEGTLVTFGLGRTFFTYDLEAARKAEEGADAQARAEGKTDPATTDEAADKEAAEKDDEPKAPKARKKPAYDPAETDIVVEVPRPKPSGTVVLRGARIITMKGREVIEHGDVVIRDNRILAVGRQGQVQAPAGAVTINVAGRTIMPGLVDIHAHIWPAWKIHRTQVWEYLANLAYGVTTTRDPQTATTDVLSYRDLVEAGQVLGPRVFGTGPGVFSSDNVQSLDDARDVLKRYSKYWDTQTIKQYMAGNRQQRQWIIMAAREQKLMPTLEGGLDLKLNLTQILDGYPGLEHTLPITPLYKDVVKLVADSGITYTPTLLVQYGGPWAENFYYERSDLHADKRMRRFVPHMDLDSTVLRRPWFHEQEYSFPQAAKVLADVVAAGGRVGLGGHGQRQGIQCHWELAAIASGGMPLHDVLKVGTIFGAEALGLQKEIGSIEKGKLADLIVLDRNPLENIRHTNSVRLVVKNGEIYEAETLDQIWPQRKPLPRQYWWDLEPTRRRDAPPLPTITTSPTAGVR